MPVVVAPFADGDAGWELPEQVGVARDHVAPHQQLVPAELGKRPQRGDPLQELADACAREFPGFVETDVHAAAAEQREQFGEQFAHQVERRRIRRVECHRLAGDAPFVDEAVGRDRHRPVAIVQQPTVHVAQAVLIRRELDMPLPAVLVELADLVGGERTRGAVHVRMVAVGEGVLAVQLHVVDLP